MNRTFLSLYYYFSKILLFCRCEKYYLSKQIILLRVAKILNRDAAAAAAVESDI